MRLRQIAFVTRELEPALDDLTSVLGLAVCHRDPGVGKWGLVNGVLPVGNDFLEVVTPVEDGTSAGRYIDRRHGDGGYMVILQCADAVAERERITGLGVRAVWQADRPAYRATHFHPADTGGILLSVDSVEPGADYTDLRCSWEPAATGWEDYVRTEKIGAMTGAELQSDDPAGMAALWSRILDLPVVDRDGAPAIELTNATLRFVPAEDGRGRGLGAIDLRATDPAAVLAAAEARGLLRGDNLIEVCGTRVHLI